MSFVYQYNISLFCNRMVLPDELSNEIKANNNCSSGFEYVSTSANLCLVHFNEELSQISKTSLDGVIASHQGYTFSQNFLLSAPIVIDEKRIVSVDDWQELGGFTTNISFFCPIHQCLGSVLGIIKSDIPGTELQLVEKSLSTAQETVIAGPYSVPVNEDWKDFRFNSFGKIPSEGTCVYILQGRVSDPTSLSFIKYVAASLLRVEQVRGIR